MNICKFCQIVNRQIPSWVVYENEKVIAFLPEKLEVYGHTLEIKTDKDELLEKLRLG